MNKQREEKQNQKHRDNHRKTQEVHQIMTGWRQCCGWLEEQRRRKTQI